MTALAADRKIRQKRAGRTFTVKLAANAVIYVGAIVCVNTAGYGVAGVPTAGFRVVGVAQHAADNTGGAAGDAEVQVATGVFAFENAASGDAVTQADFGRVVWLLDDQTMQDKDGGSAVAGGILEEIDSAGDLWCYVGPEIGVAAAALGSSGIETVTSGALSLFTRTSLLSITGTVAFTLAAGLYEGQRKSIRVIVAASTPDGTLTPAAFADGTSLDVDAVNETAELEYHDTGGWRLVAIAGATVNA